MGACASIPKAMRKGDAGAAPAPEPPKEETTTTAEVAAVEETPAADKEVKAEGEEKKEEEVEKKEGEEGQQSLGALLHEGEEEKKTETATAGSTESAPLPETVVSSEAEEKEAVYVAPVAHATDEEIKETKAN